MIDSLLNESSNAPASRCGMPGFFFRTITSLTVVLSMCGFFAVPRTTVGQETVIKFFDVGKLDFRIRVQSSDGSELPKETSVKVWLDGSDPKKDPPVLGKVSTTEKAILFTPRFSFQRGKSYKVVVARNGKDNPVSRVLDVPAKKSKPTRIESIFPSSDEIPENLLRFYVQFSAPMRKGDIYKHIRILNEDKTPVDLPFLEIEQELWSRDSTRLTLLLDPGRIKRGLKPREEMGPILVSGQKYTLVIDGKWKDANDNPIGEDTVKQFLAIDEDHTQPNPSQWKIDAPKSGSSDALKITFDGSLDWSMLFRSISVLNADKKDISGSISVSGNELVWTFVPDRAWSKGTYSIAIDPNLEDATGNSVGRQFDVDVFEKTESSDKAVRSSISFSVE